MARSSSVLLVAMVCALAAAPWQAQAHGGGFHDWDFSTPGYNYTRTLLATAGNFTFYNASLSSSFLPGDIPFFPSYAQAASIAGSVTVWEFLDTACRETVALSVNVNITAGNKQPVANEKVFIWGMVGSCVSGVLDTYKHNLTLGSQRGNMLWAARDTDFTNANGTLWGTAPNIFYPRRVATADGPALTSLLVAFAPDVSPFLCADLKWANVNAAAWTKAKADCKPTGPGDRRRQLRQRATLMGREW